MALPKIGFNEGSMLRRIVLHVATFVLGSVAFIGIVSFVLVSIASRVVAPADPTATDDEPALAAGSATPRVPHTTSTKPASRVHKRGGAVPAPVVTAAAAQAGSQSEP